MAGKNTKKKHEKHAENNEEVPIKIDSNKSENGDETKEVPISEEGPKEEKEGESKEKTEEVPISEEGPKEEKEGESKETGHPGPAFSPAREQRRPFAPAYSPQQRRPVGRPMQRRRARPKAGVPALVIVISVLYFLAAVSMLIAGIATVAGELTGSEFISADNVLNYLEKIPGIGTGDGLVLLAGVVLLILGIISLIIGIGLLKRQNWARILAVIISLVVIVLGVFTLETDSAGSIAANSLVVLINLLIILYLLLSRRVNRIFR